ncbi:hypothetical protein ES707_19685 [subsurface metagenome]
MLTLVEHDVKEFTFFARTFVKVRNRGPDRTEQFVALRQDKARPE